MHTAVLVIDVQQGLCEGPDAAHDCPGTIGRINAVTHRAREAGVPVFFIQHESNAGYLAHGSREWQLASGYPVVLVSDAHTPAGNAAINAQQVIAHHNATLTNISSFGPRVTAMAHHELRFAGGSGA